MRIELVTMAAWMTRGSGWSFAASEQRRGFGRWTSGCGQAWPSRRSLASSGDIWVEAAVATIRRVMGALDARVELQPRWRGGEVPTVSSTSATPRSPAPPPGSSLTLAGRSFPRLSYSVYGERGSVDLVATRESLGLAVMIEVKTSLN